MTRTSRTVGPDPLRRRLVMGAGVLLAAGALAACSTAESPLPTNSAPVIVPGKPGEPASTIPPGQATPLEKEEPNDADVAFVRDMIVHHGQAVEMADLAANRAGRDDVAGLADRIADTQRPEIDMLNRWLELHDHDRVDPGGHGGVRAGMPGMATERQLRELREARGERFDRLFLQLMVTHHEGALTMVEEVRTSGVDVRVQEIADDIAVVQSDEIHRMQGMLRG